jgi:hypothetical protein
MSRDAAERTAKTLHGTVCEVRPVDQDQEGTEISMIGRMSHKPAGGGLDAEDYSGLPDGWEPGCDVPGWRRQRAAGRGRGMSSFWIGFCVGVPLWLLLGAWAAMYLLAPRKAVRVRAEGDGEGGDGQ